MTRPDDPRADDLLADRALYGLDDADALELNALGADTDDTYDLAAAAIDLATLPIEPMPTALVDHILASRAPRTLAGWAMPATVGTSTLTGSTPSGEPVTADLTIVDQTLPDAVRRDPAPRAATLRGSTARSAMRPARRRPLVVTWLAVAASILVVAGASWWVLRGRAAPTLATLRADLLASAADAAPLAWKPTPEAPGASGDVVWSPSAQRGYMRFVGLPRNDPTKTQYQLWIFDRARDQAFPVDGGVFDVTASGEVIVPITAKLHVDDATLFAVTVERPGGVVVSTRQHIVVTAARS